MPPPLSSPCLASGLSDLSTPSGTDCLSCSIASKIMLRCPNGAILSSVLSVLMSSASSRRPSTALCMKFLRYCPMPIEVTHIPTACVSHCSGDVVSKCTLLRAVCCAEAARRVTCRCRRAAAEAGRAVCGRLFNGGFRCAETLSVLGAQGSARAKRLAEYLPYKLMWLRCWGRQHQIVMLQHIAG
jgi:hypothetical protein